MPDVSSKPMYLWKGKEIKVLNSEDLKKRFFNENLLYQLMNLDWNTFLLMFATAEDERGKGYTFDKLVETLKGLNYFTDPEGVVLEGLDTLLDFAIYKPKWMKREGYWQRVFFNRSELVHDYCDNKHELLQPVESFLLNDNQINALKRLYELTLMRPLGELSEEKQLTTRLEEIEGCISSFIKDHLKKECERLERVVIVPTMRKGASLVNSLREKTGLQSFDIEYGYLRKDNLVGKTVILFDDAIHKGKVLNEYIELLTKRGVNRKDILPAAYCVNEDECPGSVKDLIKIGPMKRLKSEDFRREVADIMLYIAALGEIIDPDHLMIEVKFRSPQTPQHIMDKLGKLGIGRIFEPNLDHLHPHRKKITLSFNKEEYRQLTNESLPPEVKAIDICKVRFLFHCEYVDGGGLKIEKSTIVPIVNPKISSLDKSEEKSVLERYDFTKYVESDEEYYDTPPYVDAIIYHLVTSLSKGFFGKCSLLREEARLEKLSYFYLTSKYKGFDGRLQKFQGELLQCMQ